MKKIWPIILFLPLLGGCFSMLMGEFIPVPVNVVMEGSDIIFKFPYQVPIASLDLRRDVKNGKIDEEIWAIEGNGYGEDALKVDSITYGKLPGVGIRENLAPLKINPGELCQIYMQLGRKVIEGSFVLEEISGSASVRNLTPDEAIEIRKKIVGHY